MTRTFVVGEVPDDVARWHRLCKEALDRAVAEIRDGADGRAIFDGTCEIFEAAGEPTQRTKEPGEALARRVLPRRSGTASGSRCTSSRASGSRQELPLVAGDVVTVEPGSTGRGTAACRLEDLVLVTADGAENLTRYPYDLEP